MNVLAKLTGKQKMDPIGWDQRKKELQAEIKAISSELSEKRTGLQQAEGQLTNSNKELEFYTVPPGRYETRVRPRNHKEDRMRIEQDVRLRKVAVELAEKAYRPLQDKNDALQDELNALAENPPAVAKADVKKSYSTVTALEQKLAKIKTARDSAVEGSDDSPMQILKDELEQAKSAYELAASGVHLGEATQADVDKSAQQLKAIRAKINTAEDAAASQKAAVSGYGRRIEVIEADLEQANDTHSVMVGLYGEAQQNAAIERINQAIDSIRTDLGEITQADHLMKRFRAGNSKIQGGAGLEINCENRSTIYGINTGRIRPDDSDVRKSVSKLLVGIGYPIQPEDDEE